MDKGAFTPFELYRTHYKPQLPKLLERIEEAGTLTGLSLQIPDTIKFLFPHTCDKPLVHFTKGLSKPHTAVRVGVVLSGGQAAGGHNVICGLFDALKKLHSQSHLFGFLNGPSGIIENHLIELDETLLAPFRNTGGFDLIGSGRTKIETPEQLALSLKNCRSLHLDGLVIIGGDDSNTNAAILAEYFLKEGCSTRVIGVPKTIDGDLKNNFIETSFGFDTACKVYSEMIGNICRDAKSAKKYTHFIKLMGRSASHIALECALQTHPNSTLIGEEVEAKKLTLKQIVNTLCDVIIKRAAAGKNYGIILIPEGLIEFIPEMKILIRELNTLLVKESSDVTARLSPEASKTFSSLPKEISEQLLMDRDPHGNVQVSHISTDQLIIKMVMQTLKERPDFKGKCAPVGHFFGYEGRCSFPSNFDTNYCYALGFTAAVLIQEGYTGYMAGVQKLAEPILDWEPLGIPITMMMDMEERKGKQKPVIKKALVDLEAEPFKHLLAHREEWAIDDCYRYPGPIQWAGPSQLCDDTTFTLKLEHKTLSNLSWI